MYSLPTPQAIDELICQAQELRHENTHRALELSQQAQQQSLQIDYQKGLAYGLYLNCLCHFILADQSDLLEKTFQALSLFESLDDKSGAASTNNLIALLYERQDKNTLALEYYQRCLEIHRQMDNRKGQSTALNNIGLNYRSRSQFTQALEVLFQALHLAESINDPESSAYALLNIAMIYYDTDENQRALKYAQLGLELNQQTKDRALDSTLLVLLGKIHHRLGESGAAIEQLKHSLEISYQTGNKNDVYNGLLSLGVIYQDLQQFLSAEETLVQASQIAQQLSRLKEAEVLCALGRGCQKQDDLQKALEYFHLALQAAQEKNTELLLRDIQLPLAQIYEALGDYQQALFHFRAYHQTWEQIQGLSTGHRIQQLTSDWEFQHDGSPADIESLNISDLSEALQALRDADEQKASLLNRLKKQAELLEQLAREDGLTGLVNRRWLDLKLAQEFERARRFSHSLAVALIDLDDFKPINDRLSHQVGDAVLIQLAGIMRDHFRSVDIVGRFGGDEFMLILVETPLDQALVACERLRQRVAAFDWKAIHPELSALTLSIGLVCHVPAKSLEITSPEQIIKHADEELYRAKQMGKNHLCVCES
ncbi:MAG TPA: diguanylate cyclase [Anaerolineaceae bacterium]|nr:diguanylate cyclase [Anaerolineaceae bacterium]